MGYLGNGDRFLMGDIRSGSKVRRRYAFARRQSLFPYSIQYNPKTVGIHPSFQ
jgi:hypothetical protein